MSLKCYRQLWGSLIEFENSRGEVAFRIYITGDTVFFDELKEIPRRFSDIDLALLHLGGTMFFGLLMVTMDPKQGIEVIRLVKPKTAIPIHYDDYTAFEFALGETAGPPDADPPEWWQRTKITSFNEFIAMATCLPCLFCAGDHGHCARQAARCIYCAGARRTLSRSLRAVVDCWQPITRPHLPDVEWKYRQLTRSLKNLSLWQTRKVPCSGKLMGYYCGILSALTGKASERFK